MRRLLLGLLIALCLPASAQADVRVSAFYYPWYATSCHDGGYQHWSQRDHTPPNNIASSYYPARGLYSSVRPPRGLRPDGRDQGRGHRRDRRVVVGARLGGRLPPARRCARGARRRDRRRGTPRAVSRPHRREHGRRRRNTSSARDHDVLRLPRLRHAGCRLGGGNERAPPRRQSALRADGACRAGGCRRVRRGLHLRHRHVRRRHVPSLLHRGARARTCSAPPRSARATTRAVAAATRRRSRAATERPTTRCGARRSPPAPTA